MAAVTFDGATRIYPGTTSPAVDSLQLEIQDGEFLVLVGPSGCGKSTSLRMLAGLEEVDAGTIRIGDRDVTELPPKARDIAMVFQNYALYPHMTVAENMGFALKIAGVGKDERSRRVQEAARLLGLAEYLDRKPRALSGGQRQRVAMGRAIVRQPQAFLMDEPLSNLDAKLRVQTRTEIAALQRRLGVTTVYVTHDQVEAMTMGDRVAVLRDGVLQQCDTPRALYDKPANDFVAGFIGSPAMNIGDYSLGSDGVHIGTAVRPLPPDLLVTLGAVDRVRLGFRPESLVTTATPNTDAVAIEVDLVEELGSDAFVHGHLPGSGDALTAEHRIVARVDPRFPPQRGQQLYMTVRPGEMHVFHPRTGQLLGEV